MFTLIEEIFLFISRPRRLSLYSPSWVPVPDSGYLNSPLLKYFSWLLFWVTRLCPPSPPPPRDKSWVLPTLPPVLLAACTIRYVCLGRNPGPDIWGLAEGEQDHRLPPPPHTIRPLLTPRRAGAYARGYVRTSVVDPELLFPIQQKSTGIKNR